MMPDLGKYADAVIWSYVSSAVLIAALVALSIWRNNRVKRALAEVEARNPKAKAGEAQP